MNLVRENLALLEEQVNRAEDEMGSFSSIKKMFSTLSMPAFMVSSDPVK